MNEIPKLPSFFKTQKTKEFTYRPRYWDKQKERRERVKEGKIEGLKFRSNTRNQKIEKARNKRIFLLIILLSLLVYYLVT